MLDEFVTELPSGEIEICRKVLVEADVSAVFDASDVPDDVDERQAWESEFNEAIERFAYDAAETVIGGVGGEAHGVSLAVMASGRVDYPTPEDRVREISIARHAVETFVTTLMKMGGDVADALRDYLVKHDPMLLTEYLNDTEED